MKKILFASTATAALAFGGMASAQGISLFGDARLGLGYNINNDGSLQGDEDLRAVSRVRFGVNMTGETNSGITFGATIRADNSSGGQGGTNGQTAGSVFVSGAWGTLTMGDTNGADEQNVGDVPGNYSLTGLGDFNETLYISNGGGFGDDDRPDFASNPFARPTIRYDYDFASFGVSLSSNRDLTDVGVGASWTGEFGGGSVNIGLGYYKFEEFTVFGSDVTTFVVEDENGDLVTVIGEAVATETLVQGGEQWSATVGGSFDLFDAAVIYTMASNEADGDVDQLLVGLGTTFGDFQVGGFYTQIIEATGVLSDLDGDDAWALTAAYDLGGGASVAGGVGQALGEGSGGERTVADFGIRMAF